MSRRRLVIQASQLREELDKLPRHAVVAIELPPVASDADAPFGPLLCVSAALRTQSVLVLSAYEMSAPDGALFDAIQRNDPAGCVAAMGAGADIEARDGRSPLLDYDTPLLSAAASPELVRLLLERGADPNARSGSGWTPLIRACNASSTESARLLLAAGADPAAVSGEGYAARGRVPGDNHQLLELLEEAAKGAV